MLAPDHVDEHAEVLADLDVLRNAAPDGADGCCPAARRMRSAQVPTAQSDDTLEIVGHSILLSPSQPRPRLRRIERRADNRLRCISSGVEGVAPDRGSPEYATASMPPWRVGRIAHGRSPYAKRASFLSCRVLNPIIR